MNTLIAEAVARVAERFGYEPSALLGRCRTQHLARARAEAMAEARKLGFSYPELARAFNRDHSTVMHAVRSVTCGS